MHDYFFCKKRSPYMPLLESYTIILFPDVSRQHLNAKSSIFCKQPISFQKCQNCAIFVLKFPFDNNVVFAHFQIKTQITEIRRAYTIILAYMIILISKMGNPTRLFHTAQLFESAEYYITIHKKYSSFHFVCTVM